MATSDYTDNDIDLDDTSYYEEFIDLYSSLLGRTEIFLQFSKQNEALFEVAKKAEVLVADTDKYCANDSQIQEALNNISQTYKAYKTEKINAFKLAKKAINDGICQNNLQECKNSLANLIEKMHKHNQNLKKYIQIAENLLQQNPNKQNSDLEKMFMVTYSLLFAKSKEFLHFVKEAEIMDNLGRYAQYLHEMTTQQNNQDLQQKFDNLLQTFEAYNKSRKIALETAQKAIDDGICQNNLQKCKESLAIVVSKMATHNQKLKEYTNFAKNLLPKNLKNTLKNTNNKNIEK